jgi:hypothetical protein
MKRLSTALNLRKIFLRNIPNIGQILRKFSFLDKLIFSRSLKKYRDSIEARLTISYPLYYPASFSNNSEIIFHVGFGHAGTTSLQYLLFPYVKGIHYLGIPSSNQIEDTYASLVTFPDHIYNEEFVKNAFHSDMKDHRINLFSGESLTIGAKTSSGPVGVGPHEIAHRLSRIFNGIRTKVIFTIRNQVDALSSHYYSSTGPFSAPTKERWFYDQVVSGNRIHFRPIHRFLYNTIIEKYSESFGKENVLVLPLELLQIDKKIYFKNLFHFINEPYQNDFVVGFGKRNVSKKNF